MEQFPCIYNNYKCTYPLTKQFHFWKLITQILHTNEMMHVYDYCWSVTRGSVRILEHLHKGKLCPRYAEWRLEAHLALQAPHDLHAHLLTALRLYCSPGSSPSQGFALLSAHNLFPRIHMTCSLPPPSSHVITHTCPPTLSKPFSASTSPFSLTLLSCSPQHLSPSNIQLTIFPFIKIKYQERKHCFHHRYSRCTYNSAWNTVGIQ